MKFPKSLQFVACLTRLCAVLMLVLLLVVGCATRPEFREPPAPIRFTDTTAAAGLEGIGTQLCAWGDYDADGLVDLLVGARTFKNNGGGRFTPVKEAPVGPGVWADFNNDGRQDFMSCRGRGSLWLQEPDGTFRSDTFPGNPEAAMPRVSAADANGDGWLDAYFTNYETKFGGPILADRFLKGLGNGAFAEGISLSGEACWAARAADWADFDDDGDQDLYVCNYRLMPNNLWVNDGRATFRDEAKARGVYGVATAGNEPASPWYPTYEYTGHTIGCCWGDLNNDGFLDLVVVNFSHPPPWQNRVQIQLNSGPPHYTFTDTNADAAAGIYWQESYAKGALGDYDNDGDLDLYLTTVYKGDLGELFANDGTGRFTPVGETAGVRVAASYQVGWADVDNDGSLDLLVGGRLFRNSGNRHTWLKVQVIGGHGSNRSAVGARIRVTAGGGLKFREVVCGNSGNQMPLVQHFGLGDHHGSVEVSVRFPSGKQRALRARPGTICRIEEPD